MWCRGLFTCIARCFIVRGVLFVAYWPGCIVQGVFFCVLKMCCGDIVDIFLVNSAEKCDLTRGVVLFSDHMWCNCVPVHVICGFRRAKLAAYLTGNNVALWVFLRERKALRRYFRGSVWAF